MFIFLIKELSLSVLDSREQISLPWCISYVSCWIMHHWRFIKASKTIHWLVNFAPLATLCVCKLRWKLLLKLLAFFPVFEEFALAPALDIIWTIHSKITLDSVVARSGYKFIHVSFHIEIRCSLRLAKSCLKCTLLSGWWLILAYFFKVLVIWWSWKQFLLSKFVINFHSVRHGVHVDSMRR